MDTDKIVIEYIDGRSETFVNYKVDWIRRDVMIISDGNMRVYINLNQIKTIRDYNIKKYKGDSNNEFHQQQL